MEMNLSAGFLSKLAVVRDVLYREYPMGQSAAHTASALVSSVHVPWKFLLWVSSLFVFLRRSRC